MRFLIIHVFLLCTIGASLQADGDKEENRSPLDEQTVDATAAYDQGNVFARILRGELPANTVYENDYALAFWDIRPRAKVHVLVILKGPSNNFISFAEHASPEEQLGLLRAIKKVADKMKI